MSGKCNGYSTKAAAPPRIIPAIPRKYERRNPQITTITHDSPPPRSTSQGTTQSTQDYGIEKYGKLPPPFYPASSSPTHPSASPGHGSTNRFEASESGINEYGTGVQPPQHPKHPQWGSYGAPTSAYSGNLTPPNEDSTAPFRYSPDAQPFQPQHTPPSDVTPSPTQSLYQPPSLPYPYNISFYPPATPEYVETLSSAQSLYHGYSYAPPSVDTATPAQIYTPVAYMSPIEGLPNGFAHDEPPGSDKDQRAIPQGQEAAQPAESELPEDADSQQQTADYHSNQSAYMAPQSIPDETVTQISNYRCIPKTETRPPPDPIEVGSQVTPVVEYDTWRRTALDDLRVVPEEIWHEQMMMPSFFLQHFTNPRYADCRVQIRAKEGSEIYSELLLHSVLLTYSPTLAIQLESAEPENDGYRTLVFDSSDKFITPDAIESALYTCYGRPLCDFIGTSSQTPDSQAQDSQSWMDNALAFVAAGQLLGLPAVVARGLQIAVRILNWDNIEKALSFAIYDITRSGSTSAINAVDTTPTSVSSDAGADIHQGSPMEHPLMVKCLRIIADRLLDSWTLDTSAPSLRSIDRLPQIAHPAPKPRLSHIRFGSLPMGEVALATNTAMGQDTLPSSFLLCLPLALVSQIMDELQGRLGEDTIRTLVDEREWRRQSTLGQMPEDHLVAADDVLGWEEYLETAAEDGGAPFTFSRRWAGPRTEHGV